MLDYKKVSGLQEIRKQIKELRAKEKRLKNEIEEYLIDNDKDAMELETEDGTKIQIIRTVSDYSKIDDVKLEQWLKENDHWENLIKFEEVLDQEKLTVAVKEGDIDIEDIEKCMKVDFRSRLSFREVK